MDNKSNNTRSTDFKPEFDWTQLKPLQGRLKSRTEEQIKKLAGVIKREGFRFPVFVWAEPNGRTEKLIDGHGRLLALRELAKTGDAPATIPVVTVAAKTEAEAKKLILEASSRYGDFDVDIAKQFIADIGGADIAKDFDIGIDLDDLGIDLPAEPKTRTRLFGGKDDDGESEEDKAIRVVDIASRKLTMVKIQGALKSLCMCAFAAEQGTKADLSSDLVELKDLKEDAKLRQLVIDGLSEVCEEGGLAQGWLWVCPPPRRHMEGNFAEWLCKEVCSRMKGELVLRAFKWHSKQRIDAKLEIFDESQAAKFKDRDVVLVDDIVTTGASLGAMKVMLRRYGAKAVRTIAAVNNFRGHP